MPEIAEWWESFFDNDYADVGLRAGSEEALKTIDSTLDFLTTVLGLEAGDRVLDQCCGIGRLSIPLAKRGFDILGVDLISDYIDRAKAAASKAEVSRFEFVAGDAFEYCSAKPCDAGFNWFTSFGYDEDDSRNLKMLERAFESLKPGGRFALDYISVPFVLANFRACGVMRRVDSHGNEVIVLDEPSVDFSRGLFNIQFTQVYSDGRREVKRGHNRMYLPKDLLSLFRAAGFLDLELYGSVQGEDFDRQSRRCIVVGKKGEVW